MRASRAILPAAALAATVFLLYAVHAEDSTATRFEQQPPAAPTLEIRVTVAKQVHTAAK
jgi:hypothetical protein